MKCVICRNSDIQIRTVEEEMRSGLRGPVEPFRPYTGPFDFDTLNWLLSII